MSNLTAIEKRKLESLLGMQMGVVLDFSNSTFETFVRDSVGRPIYDEKYNLMSGSKAHRLRSFWDKESSVVVSKLLGDLIDYGVYRKTFLGKDDLLAECRQLVTRLAQDHLVPELDALIPLSNERDFDMLIRAVRHAIENNEPHVGLDRLHTFTIMFVRKLCEQRGIMVERDRPLHSLFGEYVKRLREDGLIESDMTDRVLKSSISILEFFNHVRNRHTLAHDNPLLNEDEALLIFNYVTSTIRFLRSVEDRLKHRSVAMAATLQLVDDLPF